MALGVAVFSGMLGVTLFGIFFTPVFYVVIRKLAGDAPPPPKPIEGRPNGPATDDAIREALPAKSPNLQPTLSDQR